MEKGKKKMVIKKDEKIPEIKIKKDELNINTDKDGIDISEKIKEIIELQFNKITNNYEYDKQETSSLLRSIRDKLESSIKSFLSFAGYILYVYNDEHLFCKLIPLTEITSMIRTNKDETFYLGKPALNISGKPLWIIIREIPYSVEIEIMDIRKLLIMKGYDTIETERLLIDGTKETVKKIDIDFPIDKYQTTLVLKGYSSMDTDSKLYSNYTKRIFKLPKMSIQNIMLMVLTIISSCLITFLITYMYYQSILYGSE